MAVNAVSISRVTNTLQSSALLSALRRNTVQLFTEQNRISIGRQFLTPSEDPGRAARALQLTEFLEQQDQLAENIRHGATALDSTDFAMAEVSDLLTDAQSIASQNIGTLASHDERIAAAEIVASIREQLVVVGNRQADGRYLFAGRSTDRIPFVDAPDGTAYVGDQGDILARTSENELEPINLAGNLLFGALSAEVRSAVDLDPQAGADTRLEDLTGALNQGIRRGTFEIIEDGQPPVKIDLAGADTLGDVVNAINTAAAAQGGNFTAELTAAGLRIVPGGPAITVRDISTGQAAADLGVVTAAPTAAAIDGADLGVALSRTSRIADLQQGTGIDLSVPILITNGSRSASIDLSTAETVQDVLNRINNAGLNVQAEVNAERNGIDVVNIVSGAVMSIGENGGSTATALGIRSLTVDTPLTALNNGLGVRVSEAVMDLDIQAKDGTSFQVNLDGTTTVGELINRINAAAIGAGVAISADLAAVGNGLRLTDGTGGPGALRVLRASNSFAVDDLGLFGLEALGATTELLGTDPNGIKVNGAISALYDLERALRSDDSQAISIASEAIDAHLVDFSRWRGVVGARAKAMQDRLTQTDNAVFATEALLSEVRDLDFTEAVTRFQQAQTALQASLLTGSQVLNTSLLDFLR